MAFARASSEAADGPPSSGGVSDERVSDERVSDERRPGPFEDRDGARRGARMSFLDDVTAPDDDQSVVLRWRSAAREGLGEGLGTTAASHETPIGDPSPTARLTSGADEGRPEAGRRAAFDSGPELLAPAAVRHADAFEDPFGDRRASQSDRYPVSRREPIEPARIEGMPAFPDAEPLVTSQAPLTPGRAEIEANCDREGKSCETFRDHLRSRSIDQISLDISPAFNPRASEWAEIRSMGSPPEGDHRTWRNGQNQVIANGVLAGFENGRLLIRDKGGHVERPAYRDLSDADRCYFANLWRIPIDCTLGHEEFAGRDAVPATLSWKASALCHKPLYFEEPQLERYGHTAGPWLQPALSGAHFFGNVIVLPYRMGINPPSECRYPLGYYRPGNCAPWLVPPVPLSLRGGLMQAGAVLGGIHVVP
ncbi:MAG: hypothetical protein FJ297_01185 [Planctomycetes bacterium]|nr:hypothetical protein [Planctomycetota bacterium]